jgi:hypothetical protein
MVDVVVPLENEFTHSVPINDVAAALSVNFEKSGQLFLHQIINKTNKAKLSEAITSISEPIIATTSIGEQIIIV